MKKPAERKTEVQIFEIEMEQLELSLLGTSPLVPHSIGVKPRGQLLFPSPKKNQAERDTSMKHEPFEEYRDAAYQFADDDNTATRLYMPASAFKSALAQAAIDIPGAKKAQIGRLTNVIGDKVAVWGVPQIYTTVVKQADINRTPDVRTLPILPQWCCKVKLEYASSLIKEKSITNLLAAAGVIVGVGDGRPQKGKFAFGKFKIVLPDDPAFTMIMKTQGRKPQDVALAHPAYYDKLTEQLLRWFLHEKENRHAQPARKKKDDDIYRAAPPAVIDALRQGARHPRPKKNGAEAEA